MGTRLNKQTYTKLIEENIAELEKYMPEHSLEKQHTIDVLRWSINAQYEEPQKLLDREREAAIGFAEWISDEGWIRDPFPRQDFEDDEIRYSNIATVDMETDEKITLKTASELYALYKQPKK
jgi:hypothetical protein